jgi:hypothetical protein
MPRISYWNGTQWIPVVGDGVEGPPGPAGASVEVYGPQPAPPDPAACRKGDVWLMSSVRIEPDPIPEPDRLVTDQSEPITLATPSAADVVSIQPPAPPVPLIRES